MTTETINTIIGASLLVVLLTTLFGKGLEHVAKRHENLDHFKKGKLLKGGGLLVICPVMAIFNIQSGMTLVYALLSYVGLTEVRKAIKLKSFEEE